MVDDTRRLFLIDPIHKTVTSVQDGYARAGELIGTDLTDTATLWGDAADSDTSVQVIVADDSLANNTISRGFFKVTLELENVRQTGYLAGKRYSMRMAARLPTSRSDVSRRGRTILGRDRRLCCGCCCASTFCGQSSLLMVGGNNRATAGPLKTPQIFRRASTGHEAFDP